MADLLLPPHLRQARTSFRYVDSTGSSRATFTGALRTAAKGGDRLAATIEFTKHGGQSTDERSSRAVMCAFLASLRGRQNRAYLFDHSHRRRGSMQSSELVPNNTFANGTTGWSASTGTVADRVYRAAPLTFDGVSQHALLASATGLTVVQYAPYVTRAFVVAGRGNLTYRLLLGATSSGADYGVTSAFSDYGMKVLASVPYGTTVFPWVQLQSLTNQLVGDHVLIPYISLSRCALVDNGPNLFLRSDEINSASWVTANVSIGANATTAPDGNATADEVDESGTTSVEYYIRQDVTVSSSAADYAFCIALKAAGRSWVALRLLESSGNQTAIAYFNIGTGAVGTVGSTTDFSNARASIADLGNGWYKCSIVGRKTNSATSVAGLVNSTTGDAAALVPPGINGNAFYAWRGTLAQSSVPTRLVQTTTAATSGTLQTGAAVHIKGWPASTSGLLLADDQFEVITSRGSELKILTAPVHSDAAGLAYLQFEPPLRGTPADNAPIIVHQPMGRFGYVGESPGWDNDPGFWSSASCEFEEACSAS